MRRVVRPKLPMMEKTGASKARRGTRSPATKESTMNNKLKTSCLVDYKAVRTVDTVD